MSKSRVRVKSKNEKHIAQELRRSLGNPGAKRKRPTWYYEPYKLEYQIPGEYLPDWVLEGKNGKQIIVESKGYFDYAARRKMIAVKKCNPDLDIRMLFYKDQKLRKNSGMTYSQWCDKEGFLYAIGKEIPQEWLEELEE